MPNEVRVTRTDGGLVPPTFCYNTALMFCKTQADLLGCTECNEGGRLTSFSVYMNSYSGTLKRCEYATAIWIFVLIIIGIVVVITLLIIACVCCCCRNKQVYHGGYAQQPQTQVVYQGGYPAGQYGHQGQGHVQNPNESYQSFGAPH